MKKNTKISATPAQLSAAFTEWLRRFQESPEATAKAVANLLTRQARTYGEEVTPYFIALLAEGTKAQS